MVAERQQQRPTAGGAPTTGPAATSGPKAAAQKPAYDVTQVASDFTNLRQFRQQFDLSVTLLYEMLLRQRDPTQAGQSAYLTVPDADGVTNLAKQITSPMLAFNHRKWKAYNLSGKLAIRCPVEENAAPWPNLAWCERTVSKTFEINQRRAPRHWHQALLAEHIMSYGTAATNVWYCTPEDAQYALGGFPIKLTTVSPLNLVHVDDPDGSLGRVIYGRRAAVSDLPQKWQTGALAGRASYDQVTLFEDYNKYTYTAVVDNEIVDQYDHGFVDLYGNPMVPWVVTLHEPMPMRLGDVPPTFTYSSPREVWIGQPPLMALINAALQHSFYLTASRFAVRETLTAWQVIKGRVNVDHDTKTAEVQPDGDFQMVAQPNVLPQIEAALQRVESLMEAGAGAKNLLAGNTNLEASGTAIQGATTLAKAMAEMARQTQEEHNADVGAMILAMVKSETQPSPNRKFKAATGRDLIPQGERDYAPDFQHTNALPMYQWITGDARIPIDALTVEGVTTVECGMEPIEALPKEQRIQLFMNAEQMELQTGRTILPDAYKYGELLGVSNPQKFLSQIAMDEALKDQNSPLRTLRVMREVAEERMAADSADPTFWANQLSQLEQAEERQWQAWWQQHLAALAAPPPMQPPGGSGAPQPGTPGAPPAPPGSPAAPPPPGPPGAPPPAQGAPAPPQQGPAPGMAVQNQPPFGQGMAPMQPTGGPVPPFGAPPPTGTPALQQQIQGA